MEPGKRHSPAPLDLSFPPEQSVEALRQELAAREAEIQTLREALDYAYAQWMQRDVATQARLRELQAQVDALSATRTAPSQASRATSKEEASATNPAAYAKLLGRIRHIVRRTLPAQATVLVVSRGDDALLALDGLRGRHFPQRADGVYAGHHPADSAEAIAHLEQLRAQGADYLLIPRHVALVAQPLQSELRRYHLKAQYKVTVAEERHLLDCRLKPDPMPSDGQASYPSAQRSAEEIGLSGDERPDRRPSFPPCFLPDATLLVVSKGDDALVTRCGKHAQHFPQDAEWPIPGLLPGRRVRKPSPTWKHLRQQGATYLLFPRIAFWWLEYYEAFKEHTWIAIIRVVCRQPHTSASSMPSHPTCLPPKKQTTDG